MKVLQVLYNGRLMGTLEQSAGGQNSFTYSDLWQSDPDATPLSLALPVTGSTYGSKKIDRFLKGLLPDNEAVLHRWAGQYGVSPRNPFGLLSHVGRDVAGAVSFVASENVEAFLSEYGSEPRTDEQIADHLRSLARDEADWQDSSDTGQFSLAGAQRKFALCQEPDGTWSLPTGRKPTTHIFKPPVERFDNHDLNEHLSLRTAAILGLPTSESTLMQFDGEPALVLRRYDRIVNTEGQVIRLHQEDLCQSLGYDPALKYQLNDGGPGAVAIARHLLAHSTDPTGDAETFVRALAYQWAIWGTDAHSKNYSLILAGNTVQLAPLYDIASFVPYAKSGPTAPSIKLPMHIGGEYRVRNIRRSHWDDFAEKVGLEKDQVVEWVRETVASTPQAFEAAASAESLTGDAQAFVDKQLTALESVCQRINGDDVWPGTPRPSSRLFIPEQHQITANNAPFGDVWVDGHLRKGRQVAGHWRKRPSRSTTS